MRNVLLNRSQGYAVQQWGLYISLIEQLKTLIFKVTTLVQGSTYSCSTAVPEYLWWELGGRGALGLIWDSWKGWIIEEHGPALKHGPCPPSCSVCWSRHFSSRQTCAVNRVHLLLRRNEHSQSHGEMNHCHFINTPTSNDCAIHTVAMVIIMISLIIMMIRMQMMAVEMMMMIMKVMRCLLRWWRCTKRWVGKIHMRTTFTFMFIIHAWKQKWFAYMHWTGDGGTCRTGGNATKH